jgi:hypothetical protein
VLSTCLALALDIESARQAAARDRVACRKGKLQSPDNDLRIGNG